MSLYHELRTIPPDTAAADFAAVPIRQLRAISDRATSADVVRAVAKPRRGLAELATLLSPAAAEKLPELARAAHDLTIRRFGRTIRLYAPLYLSNECVSTCTYCGFARTRPIVRRTLSTAQAETEARELTDRGFRHLLLVAGEQPRFVSREYLTEVCHKLAQFVPQLSIETQVWDSDTYRELVQAGCDGLVIYQETYDRDLYAEVHQGGRKRHYPWRLAAPDRGAAAGMRRLGLGALLGLHPDWRLDVIALAAHARTLMRRWWRCEVALSVPRLRPAAGVDAPDWPVSDREFVQLICALRLALPDVVINLSTREPLALRDTLVRLGVTTMSAGSRTDPGGYTSSDDAGKQFSIDDDRSPEEFVAMLTASGYDPVWKDWQRA